MKTTADRTRQVIAENAGCSLEQAADDKNLAADLGLYRFGLRLKLEDEFCIEITDEEGAACNTVGEVVALVKGKVKGGAA